MNALRKAADILDENRIALQSMAFGRQYTTCPECSALRRLTNQKLKCLAVNVEAEGVKFFCNHCGFAGGRLFQFDRTSPARAMTLLNSSAPAPSQRNANALPLHKARSR